VLLNATRQRSHRRGDFGIDSGFAGPGTSVSGVATKQPFISGSSAGYQPLAQTAHRLDQYDVPVAGDWVGGEGNACRRGLNQGLHKDGELGRLAFGYSPV
jgi:hypothetical protein